MCKKNIENERQAYIKFKIFKQINFYTHIQIEK